MQPRRNPPPGPQHPNSPKQSKIQDLICSLQKSVMFLCVGYSGCSTKPVGPITPIAGSLLEESHHGNFVTFGHVGDGKRSQKSWRRPLHGWKSLSCGARCCVQLWGFALIRHSDIFRLLNTRGLSSPQGFLVCFMSGDPAPAVK